ncbi:MAG: SulP family inorganic anion transporter [Steroidobacteraceae bacterium]|nr:SulP family inorganic anion transporter [Pseudomonadota bacterium]MBP6106715.1 SulP family inorganic anion transporter [Steroidobacteraceae bacterium]MBP7013182.1 SulP family inorganic anion transporter [Steroidobacteraceae bacterium]
MTQEDRPPWIYRFVPALDSLRRYRLTDARADLLAGITVAAVAVPQAMAYALAAGLPAEYGLYTAIIMTAVGALFASSRQLINGPTNAISIAVLSVISIVPSVDEKIQAAVLLAFMVGIIQLVITSMRLGDLTRYISHSVIIGFTLGASALLVLDQMKNLLGLASMGGVHDTFLYRFWLTMTQGGDVNTATLSIGLATIAMVLGLRWLKNLLGLRLLPELLITVLTMAAVVAWLGLEANGVRVVGAIPARLPTAALPAIDYELIRELSGGALAIAILGLLEAIAMSKAIATQTRQPLNMNQLCLSEGLANFTGSFFQCMPGSGSLTRSAINHQAGAVSQWSGVVSAAAVALIMVALAPYARLIPRAALAGILIVSAWKMIDWGGLFYHLRVTRFDSVIIGVTAFSAVAISIEFCILIGVVMSSLLTVRRAGRMLLTEFTITPDGTIRERFPDDARCNRLLIYGLEGEMFFGASAALERHFERIEQRIDGHTRVVILRLKRARNADAAGMIMLKEFVDRVRARAVDVILCGVRADLAQRLETTRLSDRTGATIFREERVPLTSTILAIRHANQLIGDHCATCPRRGSGEGNPALRYVF